MNFLLNRNVLKVVLLAVVAIGGWVGLSTLEGRWNQNSLQQQLTQEKQKNELLKGVISHLQSETRAAEIIVTDVSQSEGQTYTTLLFQEYTKDAAGNLVSMSPKSFTIRGNEAHIDAMVVKFQGKYVEDKDPLRGRSIALFTKLFDNKQAPEAAHVIDDPNHIPEIYRGASPVVSDFEQKLWKDFWQLANNKAYRDQMGVELVQGKAVWFRFEPGFLYTLTMQADADLNLRAAPINPAIRELLRQKMSKPTTQPVS